MALEPLNANQARLQDDLRGLIRGDARCDDVILQLYSFDGGPFEERPVAVAWPRSAQDVAAIARYAAEKGLTLHFRGSGTSGGAAAIGSGVILDFSRYMRRSLMAGDDFIRVQPGAVRERINNQLRATKRRFFAPSSGHVPAGTIGSILSVDNVGPRWLRYGSPHESAIDLTVALASGEIRTVRPYAANASATSAANGGSRGFRRRFLNAALAEANAEARKADRDGRRKERTPRFDPDFDARLRAASESGRASEFGIVDGDASRSFESDFARDLFFARAFGAGPGREIRDLLRCEPWASAMKAIAEFEDALDAEQRENAPRSCGFALRDVVRDGFDPTRFFTGSEGALGCIVEATVATTELSAANGATILLFESLDAAAKATLRILDYAPTLCDLLDSRVISLTRDWDSRFETAFPQGAQTALVVELDDSSPDSLRARMDALQREAREKLGSFGCWTAYLPEERRIFRELLQKSSCARLRMAPSFQPFPYWEDVRVPVESTPDFLRDVQDLFRRERLVYSVGGHVGCGQLSIQPIIPYSADEERRAFALSEQFEDMALGYGGEIGFSKGNGRVRTAVIPKRYPKLFTAFVRVKDAFDPKNMFNPNVVVSPEMRRLSTSGVESGSASIRESVSREDESILAPESDAAIRESSLQTGGIKRRDPFDRERLARDLNVDWQNRPTRSQLEFQIAWNPTTVYAPAFQCVGCGRCRIRTAETRFCPAFRHTPDEQASCRAKANLLRGAINGAIPLETLTRDAAFKVASYCLGCHSCAVECPAQVDAARLAFRLRSAYVAANGFNSAELFALKLDSFLSVASCFSRLANGALKSKGVRWLMEKTLGIAQGRMIPPLASRPYLSRRSFRAQKRQVAVTDLIAVDPEQTGGDQTADSEQTVAEGRALASQNSIRAGLGGAFAIRKSRAKAALFIDSYANFFDPALVDAAIAILDRNGVDARPLERPKSSGQIAFALGDVDSAEEIALRNVSILREALRDGSALLTLEPSSAIIIKKEYPYFCDDADARVVCDAATDVCSFLAERMRRGEFDRDGLSPLADSPIVVGYHAPCRSLALSRGALTSPTPAQTLLQLIPEATIKRVERGCCGIAGFSGFTTRRYYESLRLGSRLFLGMRQAEIDICVSECSFCNLQIAQGSPKPTLHAIKALAASYGATTVDAAKVVAHTPVGRRRDKDPN